MFDDQFAEQQREQRTSVLRAGSFWKIQMIVWCSFAGLIFVFYWPSLATLRTLETLSLKIALSVLASILLRPLCRFVWRRRGRYVPLAAHTVGCAALLAMINEVIVDNLTSLAWNVPSKITFHAVLTTSLRYQFALAVWCIGYFAIKFFNQMEQQQELIRRARIQQRDGLIASFRYQLPRGFLTDMLDGISQAIQKSDSSHASLMIAHFGDLLHSMLEHPEGHFARLSEELTHAQEYLELRRNLFRREVRFEFEVTEEASRVLIPRWLLMPLIDECFQNLEPTSSKVPFLHLAIRRVGTRLRFDLVGHLGVLPTLKEENRVRFESLRSLLDLVYGTGASLEVHTKDAIDLKIEMPASSSSRDEGD